MSLLKFFDSSCSYSKTKEFVVSDKETPIGEIKYNRRHRCYIFLTESTGGETDTWFKYMKEIKDFLNTLNKNLKS